MCDDGKSFLAGPWQPKLSLHNAQKHLHIARSTLASMQHFKGKFSVSLCLAYRFSFVLPHKSLGDSGARSHNCGAADSVMFRTGFDDWLWLLPTFLRFSDNLPRPFNPLSSALGCYRQALSSPMYLHLVDGQPLEISTILMG